MTQFEIKEGQKEKAWHDDLGKLVEITFQRRKVYIKSEDVEVVTLAGVHIETDKVLVFPPQAAPDIAAAIKAKEARAAALALVDSLQPAT